MAQSSHDGLKVIHDLSFVVEIHKPNPSSPLLMLVNIEWSVLSIHGTPAVPCPGIFPFVKPARHKMYLLVS